MTLETPPEKVTGKTGDPSWTSNYSAPNKEQLDRAKADPKLQAHVDTHFGQLQLFDAKTASTPPNEEGRASEGKAARERIDKPSELTVNPEYGPGKRETVHWKVREGGQEVEKDVPVRTWEHNGITVQIPESYKGPIKAEDIFSALHEMPFQKPIKFVLRDDEHPGLDPENPVLGHVIYPRNDGNVDDREIRIYPGNEPMNEHTKEVIRHEWAHTVRDDLSDPLKYAFEAATLIEQGISGRPYAGTNTEDNWAVHASEEFLSPDRSRFEKLIKEQPLKSALIAIALEDGMNAHPDNSEAQKETRRRCDEAIRKCIGPAGEATAELSRRMIEAFSTEQISEMEKVVGDFFRKGHYPNLDPSFSNPTAMKFWVGAGTLWQKLGEYSHRRENEKPSQEGNYTTNV
jgi:hypothetical protein